MVIVALPEKKRISIASIILNWNYGRTGTEDVLLIVLTINRSHSRACINSNAKL
jgi:hypothetical protein